MDTTVNEARPRRRARSRRLSARSLVLIAWALVLPSLAGCEEPGSGATPLPTPTFQLLQIPDPNGANAWLPSSVSPPPTVLPVRGRAVRIFFFAEPGSVFGVALRERPTASSSSVLTPLPSGGSSSPADAGYFSVISENRVGSQAHYGMYVRAPASLSSNPANYDVEVVSKSFRADASDSRPMVVPLRARPILSVAVTVAGSGRVTSSPPGIACGASLAGGQLPDCEADFPVGPVTLIETARDGSRFLQWSGNCSGSSHTCVVVVDGSGRLSVAATFVLGSSTVTPTNDGVAPVVSGWVWRANPICDPVNGTLAFRQWDSAGHFCCSELAIGGSGSARCLGDFESRPRCFDSRHRLIQPGGCYEPDTVI